MDENKLPLLEQDFEIHKQQSAEEIHNIHKQLQELDKRVKDMEMSKQKTEYQYEQIMESLKTLNEKTIPNLTAEVQELKNKPAKRYDQAITAIFGAIFGSVGTFIASMFINK